MLSDFRLAVRSLVKSPLFTSIAILTLALGIGAATTLFSTLRALVLAPLSYPEPDRLVMVWSGDGWPLSAPDFLDLHEQMNAFTAFGSYSTESVNIGLENAQAVAGVRATAGVLESFGVRPFRGRWIEAADTVKGAPPVVVIGYGLWQQQFAGSPDLLGQSIRINGSDVTVVGIMPPEFEFAAPWMRAQTCQVWLPLALDPKTSDRSGHWLCGLARLRPGVPLEAADAEIKTLGRRLTELYPNSNTRKEFLVRPLKFEMTRDLGSRVWLLFGAVALVLLIACANVASMLLARSAQRQGEFGVRLALGARRRDLVRLALVESAVLAGLGALAGWVFAVGGIQVMRALAPVTDARKAAITLDQPVLLFAIGATLFTALVAGFPPAIAVTRTTLSALIRSDARGAVGSRSRHHLLRALIIAQVAVAFLLANGAALFSASYLRLLDDNKQLDTEEVLTAQVSLHGPRYETDEQRVQFWQRWVERLENLPGVTAAGLSSKLPLEGGSNTSTLVNDEVYDPTQRRISIERSSVTEGYFRAMGLTLLAGRGLQASDAEGEYTGVVVNRQMAERAWPGQDAIGQIMRANQAADPWFKSRVVGVVEDVRQWGAATEARPEMYTTPPKHWGNRVHLVVRSTQRADYLAPAIQRELAELDSELALVRVRTLRQVVRDATQGERAIMALVDFFMAAALGLVAVGLYGTLSYHVLQRTREIGVRMAMGAHPQSIVRMVLGQGSRWVTVGILLGLMGTLALSGLLATFVYGVEGVSLTPLLWAALAVGSCTTVACWLPARRAAALDPIVALRGE
jgi:putative ABC transport system permease protein